MAALRSGGVALVNPPISETLAGRALDRQRSALRVLNSKSRAVGIAEIKFVQIALQMLLPAMLVDALHAALEDREITLNGVRRHVTPRIFSGRVVDAFVLGEFLAWLAIVHCFVGVQTAIQHDVRSERFADSL